MNTKLFDVLARAGLDLTAEELADVLWLAARLPAPPESSEEPPPPPPPVSPSPQLRPSPPPRPFLPEATRARTADQLSTFAAPSGASGETSLYPRQAVADGPDEGVPSSLFPTPAGHALPGALRLGRALRPLMHRIPSRTQFVLDEAATAQAIADADLTARLGAWLPVLRAAPERWLDMVLIVDESPSMAIWERTIVEFGRLLERQGAFRRVQLWGLRPDADRMKPELYAGAGPGAGRGRPRPPRELIDQQGRRLILIASDCVAPIWHNGAMASLLTGWGRQGMVGIVQMLPYPLWVRTGLRSFPPVFVRAARAGLPNRQLEVRWSAPLSGTTDASAGVPVPVFALQSDPVAQWARALAGHSGMWLPGVIAVPSQAGPRPRRPRDRDDRAPARLTTEELLNDFAATASPPARRLAGYLAAVPLTLPIMRLVQRVLTPGADQVHLAEIFLSGLVRRVTPGGDGGEEAEYDFVTGARPLLLDGVRASETVDVLRAVSDHVNRNSGQPFDFPSLLADPTATGDVKLTDRPHRRFAEVAAPALRRFGGRFARLAARLETTVQGTGARPSTPARPQAATTRGARGRPGAAVAVHALLVGIDNYAAKEIIRPLRGCVNDARAALDSLVKRFDVRRARCTMLLNDEATRANLAHAWQVITARVKPGDQVLFLFSGHGAQERTDDADDADGFTESLIPYDGRTEGVPDVSIGELTEWAAQAEGRGAQVILSLDTTHAGGGLFVRRPPGNLLVLAACRENEQSHETFDPATDIPMGAATTFFLKALQAHHPDMTWADVYDGILANVKGRYPEQTPQLIGPGDLLVFGNRRRPAAPHLLVLASTEPPEPNSARTVRVNASAALGLRTGATLAIYPPGGAAPNDEFSLANVIEVEEDHVVAEVQGSTMPEPASRVEVLSFGGGRPLLRVAWDASELPYPIASGLLELVPPETTTPEFLVRLEEDRYFILAPDGQVVLVEQRPRNESVSATASKVHGVLKQLALFRYAATLENSSPQHRLRDKVTVELSTQGTGMERSLIEGESATLTARNYSDQPLYLSVWVLTTRLGVRRIYPPQSDCLLLAPGRELRVSLPLRRSDLTRPQEPMTFKIFATRHPANLDVLQLPELRPEVILIGDFLQGQPGAPLPPSDPALPAEATRSRPRRTRGKMTGPEPPHSASGNTTRPAGGPGAEQPLSPGGPAAVTAKLWRPGQRLRVSFLDGQVSIHTKVSEAARLWSQYGNISFDFNGGPEAEIRVSFKEGGTWSATGTDCLQVPRDRPTMNLGWLTPNTPDEEIRRVALREFGCALGLVMAHQSPVANIPWDRGKVYQFLTGPPNSWSPEAVEAYMFRQYSPTEVQAGPPDPLSIMHDFVDPEWVVVPFPKIGLNTDLSEPDKAFISRVYPFPSQRGESPA